MPLAALGSASNLAPDARARMLEMFRLAVRRMRTALVNRLGTDVPVRFGDLSWMAWGELQDEFLDEGSSVFVKFRLEPLGHDAVLAIEGALLHRVMGLLLGESPFGDGGGYQKRAPTRMDLSVARRLSLDILAALAETLPGSPKGPWQLVDRTANREAATDPARPRLVLLEVSGASRVELDVGRTSLMIDATLDFGPAEEPFGLITIAVPAAFASDLWPDAQVEKAQPQDGGMARVLSLPVTAVVELARVKLSLGELNVLEAGARIDLGPVRPVTLSVAGRAAAIAEPGVIEGIRCIRVIDRVR